MADARGSGAKNRSAAGYRCRDRGPATAMSDAVRYVTCKRGKRAVTFYRSLFV